MNKLDKRQIRRAFGRQTARPPLFAQAEARLWERVGDMAQTPAVVADIGGGGAFVAARFPAAKTIAADFAMPVLRQAPPGVWKIAADAEQLPLADAAADLVWSNLCAEWTDMQTFLPEAARILKDGGLLAFTTLGPDTLQELRAAFAPAARVHTFADMHDIGDMLSACGFAEPIVETDRAALTYSTAAAAVRDMRALGCGCARADRPRGLLGKNQLRQAEENYAAAAESGGEIRATIELVTATAWRKQARPAPVHFFPRAAG